MTSIIRQSLTAALLLLFSAEYVSLATVFSGDSGGALHSQSIIQHEIITLFTLLAEENHERDLKDDCAQPLERQELYPLVFPLIAAGKISNNGNSPPSTRALPIYTFHCSFLI